MERTKVRAEWTVVSGVRMHVRVAGNPVDGPAVVLVHGLVVSSRYMVPTLERLAAHHRVYAPDLPGFGRSGKPDHALDVGLLGGRVAKDELWPRMTDWLKPRSR